MCGICERSYLYFPKCVYAAGDRASDQQLLELPARVFVPGKLQQQGAYTCITQQIRAVLLNLKPVHVGELKRFLKDKLYARLPKEAQPVLPDSPEELMKHAEQYWGPLNIDVIKLLAIHLSAGELKHLVTDYEKALPADLKTVTCEKKPSVAAPPGYEIVVTRMKTPQTISAAFEMKDFLGKMKGLKGSVILLAGLGDRGTSIVFYMPAGTSVVFLQRLHQKKKNRTGLSQRGVQHVNFSNMASLDVERDGLLYNHSIVSQYFAVSYGLILINNCDVLVP